MANPRAQSITIGGQTIAPGERRTVDLPVAPMYTHDDLCMSVQVVHGKQPGPTLFISAALHGDEINGVEIIRRVLRHRALKQVRGTLLAIPIVNVYGFLNHSRYLPDGRDLNRSFPGSERGPLASRVAHTFLREIVHKSTHGIDLHTGARHRSNFPQIRADLENPAALAMTEAFGVPLAINARVRDGSLRGCAGEEGIPILLYEAGEALRFEEMHIRAGVRGVINVMRGIGMLRSSRSRKEPPKPIISEQTTWVRAADSGVLRTLVPLGAKVAAGQVLALIGDPLGTTETEVLASAAGVVIGRTNLPLVYEGDAIFHIAHYGRRVERVGRQVEAFQETFLGEPGSGDEFPEPAIT
ncbi:succinylglutamate desuccinylase/aspartoacylase family protein [Mangrovimicrobium sediminis]|uniref:Succinylglutamate desuccinylase/aspartoacylase family protein n=1 Tax=Mangrovimicrobium sediminis TaxID=2562682 RepID=A0A4Z0M8H0_9GAMM|nr:succinylglutamate desuccinylase/aspartoacylase family protein [Haliea sp. SAOS-164]TGD75831.1 succinylglutamate desuccinylase/aspartoacylase family protein [Haliea sp. SAOS-164]